MTYREIAVDLIKEMIPFDVKTLEELNEEWQQELEREGCSEKLKAFCRGVTEAVIEHKKEQKQ